jgi:nucleolar protein 56
MAEIDYVLLENAVGYSIFQVVMQPETIGNRLKEVQESVQDLARFGKMIKLVSFAPFQYVPSIASFERRKTVC